MRLLGLSAGAVGGSAEILLKEALRGAEDVGAEVELVRLVDLDLSTGPDASGDDAQWFWDRLMSSDGLVVSSPIYARTLPGLLRLLGDKISGPQADVAFTAELLRMRSEGADIAVDFAIDERVLKPRVAGFIAVGGSLPTYWKTLALPLMHTLTASAQIAVVDQVEFAGAGSPSSIVLDPDALQRAGRLGRAVGEQLGRPFDEVEYRGEPGACPLCHLSVFALRGGDRVECAACGAGGVLRLTDGAAEVTFDAAGLAESVISLDEKRAHFREVQDTAARHAAHREHIDRRKQEYLAWDPRVVPPPAESPVAAPALDHVGLSVADLDTQLAWYATTFGWRVAAPFDIAAVGLRGAFVVSTDGQAIELLERRGSSGGLRPEDPQSALLTRGFGHVCIRVDDTDDWHARLLAAGAVERMPPADAPERGVRFSFVTDPEGNLVELLDRPRPVGGVGAAVRAEMGTEGPTLLR